MFTHKSLIVSFALILALVCTGVIATSAHTALQNQQQRSVAVPFPKGIAAISSIAHGNDNLLSFLDVRHYIATKGFIGGSTLTGQPPILQSLQLLNVRQLDSLLNFVLPEQPGNEQVYYAHIDGPLLVVPDLPLPILSTLLPSLDNLPAFIPHLGNLSWLGLSTLSFGTLANNTLPKLPLLGYPQGRMPDLSHLQRSSSANAKSVQLHGQSTMLASAYEIFDAHTGNLLAWG